jgi:uncharacterized iron-regulated membrane protein
VLGVLAAIFIMLFLTGTTWFAFRPTGAVNTRNLPNCDDDQVVADLKHDSPYVVWAQESGTQPITGLRDIRAGAWDAQNRLQYCTATAVTASGSYVVTYGLSLAPTRQGRPWSVSVFPNGRPGI